MDLVEVARIIRARWYVLVPLLLLTVALAVGVNRAVPTKYQSTSSITLLASQSATVGTNTLPGTNNAFMNFNSSLNDTADFLVRRLGSTDAANDLRKRGVTETYVVALAAAAQGPFITLSVTGTDPRHALSSMNTLTAYTQEQLQAVQVQASVKQVDMIRSMVIVPPGPPSAQHKTKTQDVLGTTIGGLVVTFLAVFVVENLAASRKRRRRTVPFGAGADLDAGVDADVDADIDVDAETWRRRAAASAASEIEIEAEAGTGERADAEVEVLAAGALWYAEAEGVDGANGTHGTNGANGANGANGTNGTDGVSALERDPFEPARPELTGRAPGPRD
jgi:capsular polysaccharide biosynthesis protein